jgi:hypothetical protein
MDTGILDFFNKKLILDYYFYLMSCPYGTHGHVENPEIKKKF